MKPVMKRNHVSLLTVLTAAVLPLATGEEREANASKSPGAALLVTPNRTLPKVEPPKETLEFSATPTVQEIFRARLFEEPLVPIGGEPSADENAALAIALLGYAKRNGPDDFSSLTGFLEMHPKSRWRAALLTDLGFEYYN